MSNSEYFVAKTFSGLEPLLANELESLGAVNCQQMSRSVAFEGPIELLYRVNYFSRLALRVLWRQTSFSFGNNRQFYEHLFDFCAEKFLQKDGTLAVHATTVDSIFKTPLFASVLAKDAICDRFRDLYDQRPSVDKEHPDVQFHLHIFKDQAQLFLDSSGESLHKRGYKVRNHPAPINEVVAAAMIKMSDWNADCDFIDPMCGGGTLLVEAAMQALNIPAGFYRRHYGFFEWKNFDADLWRQIKREASIRDDVPVNFYGSDINPRFLDIARENIAKARLQDFITLERKDMLKSPAAATPALVMFNPPYGERLEVDDMNDFYANIGDTLKQKYSGCRAFMISSDTNALKHVGLKPSKKCVMFNGPLECRFVSYELFAGNRKSYIINGKHRDDEK